MKLRMKRNLFAFVFFDFIVSSLSAQVHVVGNVLSEKGVGVEYVSVQVDSIYMISDSKGHFDITIPQGHTSNMIVSHLSFESQSIPFGEYKGGKVSVLLKEKSYILSDVTISNKKQKISQIVGTGVAIPGGVIYYNCNHTDYETGPVIRSNHNYQVTNVKFHVNECTYSFCTIRIIIYEIVKSAFIPIHHFPIYIKLDNIRHNYDINQEVTENIQLKEGHQYMVGLAIVESNGTGKLHLPGFFHKGYVRAFKKDKLKKLPVSTRLSLYGRELRDN